ncbi:hypoxanthine-guanine phosphoribosyltransferase [Steccherinum ochraceum]|uniref:Hypoxanthine-guanine phosphoribosyltransferase n=1 Tax=Steccherinum ochraceum TaxID=92696 RepID=A0A4V2MXC6_9APHY|nr:hypoxanthine-guanine phosphoribosyltransferase [Steccherinum ochraceum]
MGEPEHLHMTYNDVHKTIEKSAKQIAAEFKPDLFIAIGFFPARVMRTFLKDSVTKRNIPIYAIGLSLYEELPGTTAEQIGSQVIRTQWLGPESGKTLLGRRVLIVDEVDDSRKTLHYAVSELQADVEREIAALPEEEREAKRTKFAVFVVHNKLKEKLGSLPDDVPYYAGENTEDLWLDYPWEASDIEDHDRLADEEKASGKFKNAIKSV